MKLDDVVEVNLVDRSPKETYLSVSEMAAKIITEDVEIRIYNGASREILKNLNNYSLNYALGQEKNILNIFEKGYFELSNNSAERAVKESVMGRKNWLFSSTFEGARALSLVYTAKLNQSDPEKYLRKVLTKITNIEVFDPERLRHLLP